MLYLFNAPITLKATGETYLFNCRFIWAKIQHCAEAVEELLIMLFKMNLSVLRVITVKEQFEIIVGSRV